MTPQHVSSDIVAHHQELLNCNYNFWFYSLLSLLAAVMAEWDDDERQYRSKHVGQSRKNVIINCPTQLHLVGHFYKICIMMHGSMNVKFLHLFTMYREWYSQGQIFHYIYLLAVCLTTLSVSRITQRRMFVLDEMWKEAVVNLGRDEYVVICLKEMRWTTKTLGQDSLHLGSDRTGHLPEKSEALPIGKCSSVCTTSNDRKIMTDEPWISLKEEAKTNFTYIPDFACVVPIKDRDASAGTACLGVVLGILVLLCLLDQKDGNRQCFSTCTKQNFHVKFPL